MGLRWSEVQILSPRPNSWIHSVLTAVSVDTSFLHPLVTPFNELQLGQSMSRLDSFIRRLNAQRNCIDLALGLVNQMPGPFLELGLGNGRTYDHLRESAPDREIFVFDRKIAAHPDCRPPRQFMVVGEFSETLECFARRYSNTAVLVHCDIGSGQPDADRVLVQEIGTKISNLMADGGVVLSDQSFDVVNWHECELPEETQPGRYYIYRKISGSSPR